MSSRQFNTKILSKGIIDPNLHYGIWSKVWWETVNLELDAESKQFVIPYRLYICIECELNNKSFVITVLSTAQNPLKSGFQCTCGTVKSNVEPYPSAAINTCYQQVFENKTEYSGLAAIGFENEDIIQELIADVETFPIFLQLFERHNIVITSIGDIDEDKFHSVGTGFVSSFTTRYHNAQHLFFLRIEENQCSLKIYLESECINHITGPTPDDVWKE
ncbi:7238_t:CDS:1, partial [Scutellospora calospora]